MNDQPSKPSDQLPATYATRSEAESLRDAVQESSGMEKLLKFKKGRYFLDGEEIDQGTRFLVHVVGFARAWVKFKGGELKERRMYRASKGEQPPPREDLDDKDPKSWDPGPDGHPSDPWVYQFLLPMEAEASGDFCFFVTSSFGGKRAVSDLVNQYSRRHMDGQPMIELSEAVMPTKRFGDVARPFFKIVGWDRSAVLVRDPNLPSDTKPNDMNDEIPF